MAWVYLIIPYAIHVDIYGVLDFSFQIHYVNYMLYLFCIVFILYVEGG